jgi:capsid protein
METTTEILALRLAITARMNDAFVSEARRACEDLLEEGLPDSTEGRIIEVAASRISRRPTRIQTIQGSSLLDAIARAWVAWATHSEAVAIEGKTEGKALDTIALKLWARAVEALIQEDLPEAVKWFTRASRFSSEYATDSNALIQWTYAASVI